jgi:tellurite resistance protein
VYKRQGLIAYEQLYPDGALHVPFYGVAILTLIGMAANLRWFTESGFAPTWGAFTFPLAAFTVATMVMADRSGDLMLHALAVLALLFTTVVVLSVAARVFGLWRAGGMKLI